MVLAAGSFADDLRVGPTQTAKVHRQGDARQPGGGRGATALADGNVIRDFERQRSDRPPGGFEHLAVGIQNEVVFELSADFAVAPGGGNGEFFGCTGVNLDIEIHRQRGSVKGRAKIGGRGGQSQAKPGALRVRWLWRHVHL